MQALVLEGTHRLLRMLRFQVQQLRNDDVAGRVVDRPVDADDALPQQAGVDVEGALAWAGARAPPGSAW